MQNKSTTIIIPAYQPQPVLIKLVQEMLSARPEQNIIIINDGSDPIYEQEIFSVLRNLNIPVLVHDQNLGKGQALKTGFAYYLKQYAATSPGVVTADADGQHLATDIITLCRALEENNHTFFLGIREFDQRSIPWRSRFGNVLTKFIFKQYTGLALRDTQTGLRGIPNHFLTTLTNTVCDGYDFELEMLLLAVKRKIKLKQLPIKTVYENHNQSSHFHPILDSIQIYFVFIRFSAVSLISALIDFAVFYLVILFSPTIFFAMLCGRVISGFFNFNMNKSITFRNHDNYLTSAGKYITLAFVLGLTAYAIIRIIHDLGVNIFYSKILGEMILFSFSFAFQHLFVFKQKSL